ncbi:MAG TPA: transcriptional regulator [Firmicutes bacterium]|nr:transcriptional regulator [Bacillota bacterium]
MVFDYKKEYKEFYQPSTKPTIVEIPPMNFVAVRGAGDPNEEGGAYQAAIEVLYAVSYTIKMSHKGKRQIEGYFPYVVPPLEGFWWQEGVHGVDYTNKASFNWISVIRLPDFVSEEDLLWAKEEVVRKKKLDCSVAEYITIREGLCVQAMHLGPYDDEPRTVAEMDKYLEEQGYENDFSDTRMHHEIYLSDPRKVMPDKYRTVIRHPIRKR